MHRRQPETTQVDCCGGPRSTAEQSETDETGGGVCGPPATDGPHCGGLSPGTVLIRVSRVTLKPSLVNPDQQLLTVDRSARGSMKTAAKCVSACESQDYQMHRPVERTLRRRHYQVLSPLPDECPHQPASIPAPCRPLGELFPRAGGAEGGRSGGFAQPQGQGVP